MDAFDCIATKLDVREFDSRPVPQEVRTKILEAARSTGTGLNTQHWRFIVVSERLDVLAKDSTSGAWVSAADFAIITLTNPKYRFHLIDAGRAVQNMQLAAWNFGVASGVFTGIDEPKFRADFGIPDNMNVSMTVGFGHPARPLAGKKSRNQLEDLVYYERFGSKV